MDAERGTKAGDGASGRHQKLLYSMAEQTEDRVQLRNEVLQGLMAAQKTTVVLISNVFFLLSRHPKVWDDLRQEALSPSEDELEMDVLLNMKYLRNVLSESMFPLMP